MKEFKTEKKSKALKIVKTVIIIAVMLIILSAVGVYCVFNFYIKPKYSQQIMDAVNIILEDEEFMSEIEQVVNDEQVQSEINEVIADEQVQADIIAAAGGENSRSDSETENSGKSAQAKQPAENNGQTDSDAKSDENTNNENKSMMEIAKENVPPADFAAGMKIAGKIDVGYLSGLASGGITAEEKQAAKAHLKGRLSGAEISKLKQLIAKYSYLLN